MTRRAARLALGLYPLAFRRRYGQEMSDLLEHTPVRAGTVLDLLRGAVRAHLRPPATVAGVVGPGERLRASASGVLACWVVFAAAGFGFYKTTENFSAGAHPRLGDVHFSIQALAAAGSAAVLLGALPLIVAALAQARREPALRLLVSVPALAVAVFAGLTGILVLAAASPGSSRPTVGGGLAFIAWGLAGLVCGGVCVVAARRVLFAVPVSRAQLLTAFACGTLVTAAMAAITLATAVYAIVLPIDAPRLAGAANGPLQVLSVSASLVIQVALMALAAMFALIITRRGWRAAGQLASAR